MIPSDEGLEDDIHCASLMFLIMWPVSVLDLQAQNPNTELSNCRVFSAWHHKKLLGPQEVVEVFPSVFHVRSLTFILILSNEIHHERLFSGIAPKSPLRSFIYACVYNNLYSVDRIPKMYT